MAHLYSEAAMRERLKTVTRRLVGQPKAAPVRQHEPDALTRPN